MISSTALDHVHFDPLLDRRAAVGALIHLRRAFLADALMSAGGGKVRLRLGEAHDARRLTAERRLKPHGGQ